MKVLVVEPDEMMRHMLATVLQLQLPEVHIVLILLQHFLNFCIQVF